MKPFTESPAAHLRSAYLRIHRVTNRVCHPFETTADQYVLMRLQCELDGISQQQLGRLSASDPTTIGRISQLMETRELVVRKADENDRRSRRVFLPQNGRDTADQIYDECVDIRDALETAVLPAALKQLLRGLSLINAAMEELDTTRSTNPAISTR